MFQKTAETFLSSDGKTASACYFYTPVEREPVGIVQISHGMCEYLERYEELAEELCRRGFVVCGNDHLGHGNTAPSEAELGYFAEKDGGNLLVEDLEKVTKLAKSRYPGLPYFLFGHSMGSFVARMYLSRYASELAGAVICGTTGGNPMAGMGAFLAGLTAKVKGEKYRSPLLTKMAFGAYNKRFTEPKSANAWLSRDAERVAKYDKDPFCTFTFTASAYRELFTLVKRVSASDWAKSVPQDLPIFLIAGEDDPVGDYGKGVRKVGTRLLKAGAQDLSCHLYPKGRHEVLNELNRAEVTEDVCRWLEDKLKTVR